MKITIYELLGMIKDGKAPKKIEFDTEKYLWCEEQEEYRRYPYENNLYYSLWSDYDLSKCLNEEVAILEHLEEEKKIPEKLEKKLIYTREPNGFEHPDSELPSAKEMFNKINEIIDYLKSKGE